MNVLLPPHRLSHPTARTWPAALLIAAVLAGCGNSPKQVPSGTQSVAGSAPGPAYGSAAPSGSLSPALQAAHDQLQRSLRGTDVSVARSTDGRLWLTFPGDISFQANRSALLPGARTALDRVVVALRRVPAYDIRIVGHTDSRGSVAGNNNLSVDRAAATRDWLVARGLMPQRIAVTGRGSADPVASNDTDAGRASNRRVEILIGERSNTVAPTAPAGRR